MPLAFAPAARPGIPAGRLTRAVVLLVLAFGAFVGWRLGVAADHAPVTRPVSTRAAAAAMATSQTAGHHVHRHGHGRRAGRRDHPAMSTVTAGRPATVAAPGAATGHAALVTLTPTTGVTGLAHLDRPLTPARIQRLAARTAPGIVTLTTDLGGGRGDAGTGIVLSPDGDVLTNAHVIAGYRHTAAGDTVYAVDLADARTYPVAVVGQDRVHDIALVHLEGAHDLPVARLGDSRELHPGQQLASLGNAYGRGELAIGAGPLTATGQAIASTTGQARPLTGLLRVHNGIVPGQSGGPLIDRDGWVVGINVAYLAGADHSPTGDGYAIPLWTALHAAQHLIRSHSEHEHLRHHGHTHHLTHHVTRYSASQVA